MTRSAWEPHRRTQADSTKDSSDLFEKLMLYWIKTKVTEQELKEAIDSLAFINEPDTFPLRTTFYNAMTYGKDPSIGFMGSSHACDFVNDLKTSQKLLNQCPPDINPRDIIRKSLLSMPKESEPKIRASLQLCITQLSTKLEQKREEITAKEAVKQEAGATKQTNYDAFKQESQFISALGKAHKLNDSLEASGTIDEKAHITIKSSLDAVQKNPSNFNPVIELAKTHEAVAGGRLSAMLMLVAGYAAKIFTLGCLGQKWIDRAREKLGQIKPDEPSVLKVKPTGP